MQLYFCDVRESLYQEAKNFFLNHWFSSFLSLKKSSLIGRYLVFRTLISKWVDLSCFREWIYKIWQRYFSVSHSRDKLCYLIWLQKVAVDLEKIVPRDLSLLQNGISSRDTFYLQWCAKECLVKYLDLDFSEVEKMKIQTISEDTVIVQYFEKVYSLFYVIENGYCRMWKF